MVGKELRGPWLAGLVLRALKRRHERALGLQVLYQVAPKRRGFQYQYHYSLQGGVTKLVGTLLPPDCSICIHEFGALFYNCEKI